jgi:hypothetical protein
MSSRIASRARLLCVIPVLAAAPLIAACAGSSSTGSTTSAGAQNGHAANSAHDPVNSGSVTRHAFPGTGGGQVNDENPASSRAPGAAASEVRRAPGPRNPCTLVSRTEAQGILGRPIATPVEAPLGPTCIFRPTGAGNLVTLTVGSSDVVARVKPHLHNRSEQNVDGRLAYCADYGQAATFVPLGRGRILTVTAPCAVGVRFAAKAVPRLSS